MQKYSSEQKAEALKSIEEIGVSKTHEATGISVQTLYKWRNEAKTPAQPKDEDMQEGDILAMLTDTSLYTDKIAQLEAENAKLQKMNEKLRKALALFIEV